MKRSMLQIFFASQVAMCKRFDNVVFGGMAVDGNGQFTTYVRGLQFSDASVADVGCGKTPFFSANEKISKRLRVTGVDISSEELQQAPEGALDATIVSPIEECRGLQDHDFVLAQSVLEHVRDGRAAARGICALLRPGGVVITFCPSKNACFARLNLLLSERIKRRILFWIFPEKRERQGFPAFYDGCSVREFEANMRAGGVERIETRCYFTSSYFMFFFPAYLAWRIATFPLMRMWPSVFCETFMFIGRKVKDEANA